LNAYGVRLLSLAALASVLIVGCGKGGTTVATTQPAPAPKSDPTFVEPEPAENGVVLKLDPDAKAQVANRLRGEIEVAAVPGKPSLPAEATGRSILSMDYSISVARNDASKVVLAFTSTPLKLEGKAKGQWEKMGGQEGKVSFDHRGALLEDPDSLFEGLFGAGMIAFPENPVAPGSTWSSKSYRNMPPFGEVEISEIFTYKGVEERNGKKVHRIDSTATGSIEDMKVTATYYVTEDGLPYEAAMTSVAQAPIGANGQKQPIWARFTVKVDIGPR